MLRQFTSLTSLIPIPALISVSWFWWGSNGYIWQGTPSKTEFIYKNCVFILTCLNFSHLQSTLHLMQYTYQGVFSTAQNSFWTRQFWCLLVLLPFFVSPLPHQQNTSLWGLFSSGETKKKVSEGEMGWIGRVGHRRSCHFWSKTAEHSAQCGQLFW